MDITKQTALNRYKPVCYNCEQEHEATNKECPERIRQNNIHILMAQHHLSYHEASLEIPKIEKKKNATRSEQKTNTTY